MNLAIILEDIPDTANRLKDIIQRQPAPTAQVEVVPYLRGGVKRRERDIANEAARLVLDRETTTAFLVDLAAERDDVGFGLEVIRQIASVLKPRAPIGDFLRDSNFFVIVVTVFGLSPNDLLTAWGALAGGISISRVADSKDVEAALQTKANGKLNIPVVYKPDKERLIPPLVNGWL